MPKGLKLLTPPTVEPVSLAEAKEHLYITADDTAADADVLRKLAEARRDAERECDRQFCTATWRLLLDDFPRGCDATISLPLPPLQSVTAVEYYDAAGVLTTVAAGDYFVAAGGEPGRVVPKAGYWPAVQCGRPEAVRVDFVCGYGAAAAVPADVKGAIKLILADRWQNRGDDLKVGVSPADRVINPAALRVLTSYRGHLT